PPVRRPRVDGERLPTAEQRSCQVTWRVEVVTIYVVGRTCRRAATFAPCGVVAGPSRRACVTSRTQGSAGPAIPLVSTRLLRASCGRRAARVAAPGFKRVRPPCPYRRPTGGGSTSRLA